MKPELPRTRQPASTTACRPGGTSGGPRASSPLRHQARRPQVGAGSVRPPAGRRSPDRDQDRRPSRKGRLNIEDRQRHVPVTRYRPDLYLPHPHQARREGPGGDRPGGATPRRLATARASTAAAAARVSSHDHYSQPGPADSVGLCPAPGTGQAAGRDMHRMTQPGLIWGSVPTTRDISGGRGTAGRTLEQPPDRTEPDGVLLPFPLRQPPGLPEPHPPDRATRAALASEIVTLLAEADGPEPVGGYRIAADTLRGTRSDSN